MKKINMEQLGNVTGGLNLFPGIILSRDPRNDDKFFLDVPADGRETEMTAGRKYAPSGMVEREDITRIAYI